MPSFIVVNLPHEIDRQGNAPRLVQVLIFGETRISSYLLELEGLARVTEDAKTLSCTTRVELAGWKRKACMGAR